MKLFQIVTDTWTISQTQRLFGLTLCEGASIQAPEGKQVTLVYNGENLPLLPGSYEGDVVLEVTDNCPVQGSNFRAAVVLDGGAYRPEKSVTAMAQGGSISDTTISGISVTSMEEAVNGVFAQVPEEGEVVIEDARFHMTGNGGNDFIGYGAAIAATGHGKLTVNCTDIVTHGAARGAIYAGDHVRLEVNDSTIQTRGGVLNADYQDTIKTTLPGVMRRVPWMLGLRGNCRATNLLDYAEATYNRCDLSSDGWGVLSTDGVKRCRMYVNDSNVEITGSSGYGALSIGDCVVSFNSSSVKAPDYGLVLMMGQAGGIWKNGTEVRSKRFGVMSSMNTGLMEISDSTVITKEACFLVKGCSTEFRVRKSRLQPENGVILQVMDADDPGNPTGYYCDPTGEDTPLADWDVTTATAGRSVLASFADMQLYGDIYNGSSARKGDTGGENLLAGGPGAMPAPPEGFPPPDGSMPPMPEGFPAPGGEMPAPPEGFSMPDLGGPQVKNLRVDLKNTCLTGRITATVARHRVEKICKENCEELGEVINTPSPAVNNGVIVTLDETSIWILTGPSYLTALTLAPGAVLRTADGYLPKLRVNGVPVELAAGTYVGRLELKP